MAEFKTIPLDMEEERRIQEEIKKWKDDETDVDRLKQEMADMKKDLEGVKEHDTVVKKVLEDIKENVADVNKELDDIKEHDTVVKRDLKDIKVYVTDVRTDLDCVEKNVTEVKKDLKLNNSAVHRDLEVIKDNVRTNLHWVEKNVTEVKEDLKLNNSAVKEDLDGIKERVCEVMKDIDDGRKNVHDLKEVIDDIKKKGAKVMNIHDDEVKIDLIEIRKKVSEVMIDIKDGKENVSEMKRDIEDIKENVTKVNKDIEDGKENDAAVKRDLDEIKSRQGAGYTESSFKDGDAVKTLDLRYIESSFKDEDAVKTLDLRHKGSSFKDEDADKIPYLRSLETSYKAEDETEIYRPRDDDEELDPFLCSGKVKSIKKLIESGRLPSQRILDEMCQIFGRKSKAIIVTCKAICEHIKSKHVAITHVWASYTIENPQRITFVITVKHKSEDDKSTKHVRLDKLIKYSYVKQYVGDFSLEGSEVIKQQTSASEKLDEESYQNLQSCISKHSEDLMKRHRNLSIISACSNRSKRFGESWELLPEKCIVFYVQKKSYIPIDEEPFERYYGGIAVDVREGAFIPFGRTAREKLDPVKMGCQIRGDLYTGQYVEGTLGCFVDHPQFGVCGLTCAHVLLSPWELLRLKNTYSGSLKWPLHDMYKNVYQPANQNSSIGHTVQFIYDEGSSTKSGMELALFKITDRQPKSANFPDTTIISASSVNNIKYDSWRICSTDRLNKKENLVIKFGSKTEFRHGTIMFDNTAVKNLDSYPLASGYAVIKLFKQIEVKTHTHDLAFADLGDSGALVFLAENNSQYSCIGIVEGGTTYGTVVVTPIVPILEALKVQCLKSFESETNLTNIDNQIQSIHGDMQNMKCDLQSVRQDIKNIDNTLQIIAQSFRNNQQ